MSTSEARASCPGLFKSLISKRVRGFAFLYEEVEINPLLLRMGKTRYLSREVVFWIIEVMVS